MKWILIKSWMQTRERFFIALASIAMMFVATLLAAPWLIESFRRAHPGTKYGFDEYLWRHWYGSTFVLVWSLCAIVLACGGLVWERARGASVFTLSLPIKRRNSAGGFLMVVSAETMILAMAPTCILAVWRPDYPLLQAVLFGVATFSGGSVFLALSFAISHLFEHTLTSTSVAVVIAASLWLVAKHPKLEWLNVFDLMTGEDRLNSRFLIGNVSGVLLDGFTVLAVSSLLCAAVLAVQKHIEG